MQRLSVALLCALLACLLAGAMAERTADISLVEEDAQLELELEHELSQEAEEQEHEEQEEEEADSEAEENEEEEEAVEEEEQADEEEEQADSEEEQEEESSEDEAQSILDELDAPADADAGLATIEDDAPVSEQEASDLHSIMNEETAAQQKVDVTDTNLHQQYLPFTKHMELLPESLAETSSQVKDDDEGGGGGKNPTYILPVDPFNYYPFFNGFSNVNPFSQFYPPPPYLYPQYVNHMQRYASRSNPTPPPYPGGNYPGNSPAPFPHLYYPFGAYKLDTNGPDVPSGSNSPPPFPQFVEESATVRPHILTEDSPFRHPEEEKSNTMSEMEGVDIEAGNLNADEQVEGDFDVFTTDVEYSD